MKNTITFTFGEEKILRELVDFLFKEPGTSMDDVQVCLSSNDYVVLHLFPSVEDGFQEVLDGVSAFFIEKGFDKRENSGPLSVFFLILN